MRCLLHIGFHKTASTWLQRHVFPSVPKTTLATGDARIAGLIRDLRLVEDDRWSPEPLRTWLATATPEQDVIVSDEALSGEPWAGGFNRARNAARLAAVFDGRAHVLVVVRNQRSMLRSFYTQHIHSGGYQTVEEFLAGRAGFHPSHLHFDLVVGLHRETFGTARVTVLPFEWLASSPDTFVETLCDRVALPRPTGRIASARHPNRSLSPASRRALVFVNRHLRRSRLNPRPTVGVPGAGKARRVLQDVIDPLFFRAAPRLLADRDECRLAEAAATYAESNRRLQRLTDLPLADLGYPL